MPKMKEIVLYYTYGGSTKHYAEKAARKRKAEVLEIKPVKKPGKILGCLGAIRGKSVPIEPLGIDFSEYSRVTVMSPVWAGSAHPVVNAALSQIPKGTEIDLKMVSSGGSSNQEKIIARAEKLGLKVKTFEDIKSGS